MKIGVIGCGAYSLAISLMLNKNNNDITLWSESIDNINTINSTHVLNKALPNIKLPENIKYTNDIKDACTNKDILFIIVAAQYVESVINNIKDYISEDTVVCLGTKGIEQNSCRYIHEIILGVKKLKHLAVISGPGFAIDIANNNPVGLTLASTSEYAINLIKKSLETDNLKLEVTDDIIGTEICGSIKNVLAIGAGIIDGLGFSNSTQALFITDMLGEIKELIKALGGNKESVLSYAGIGDILLTCTSTKSRNFRFGQILGLKKEKEYIDNYLLNNTVEGYYTLNSIYKLLNQKNINIEIINILYDIIYNNKDVNMLVDLLIK